MADVVDYEICGEGVQFVEVALDKGETIVAEAGTMMYMGPGIEFETRMGDGTPSGVMGKLMGAAKRVLTSESLFMTHFTNTGTNESGGQAKVAFSAPYPGQIIAVDMSQHDGEIICQKDSFLCAAEGTELSIAFNRKLGAGFFGGEGFILQRLRGDGMAFIQAGGSIVQRRLNGEKLRVDTGCIVGFEAGIDYDIELAGGLKSMLFGSEGLFLATLEGTGVVWLQSLPFARMADRVLQNAVGLQSKGES